MASGIGVRTTRARTSSLLVQCLVYLSIGAPIGMLGAGWPDARDRFDASVGALGLVAAGYGIGRVVTSAVALSILRRWHLRTATAALCGALALACATVATTTDLTVLSIAFTAIGLASGCLDSLGNRYQSVVRDVGSAGLMFGAYGVGSTLGPAVVALSSWTIAYLGSAVVAAGTAAAALRGAVAWPEALRHPEPPRRAVRSVHVPARVVAVSLAVFAIYVSIEVVTANWAASYLEGHRDLSPSGAAWAMSGFWFGITVGRLALGRLAASARGAAAATVLTASAVAVAVLYGAIVLLPMPAGAGVLLLAGLALAPVFPTLMSTTADRVGVAAAGKVTGWQLLTANLSATGTSMLVGVGVDGLGTGLPAVVLAGLAVVGLPLALRAGHLHATEAEVDAA
jgi:predicted MFS family arabinose efflux permease